jgi:aspartate aminotransferase
VGGNDFGSPDHLRISYATSMERIGEGLDRIEAWLGSL